MKQKQKQIREQIRSFLGNNPHQIGNSNDKQLCKYYGCKFLEKLSCCVGEGVKQDNYDFINWVGNGN